MLLTEIKRGQSAKIVQILPSEFRDKLMEMGCLPGVIISLAMKAPLGDPLAFYIEGYCLSMRRKEAEMIEVSLT